jgi:hypothetical protein
VKRIKRGGGRNPVWLAAWFALITATCIGGLCSRAANTPAADTPAADTRVADTRVAATPAAKPAAEAVAVEALAAEKRLGDTSRVLASKDFGGRPLGSKGNDLAAEHIAGQFRAYGVNTAVLSGTPFQKFSATTALHVGKKNRLALVATPKAPAKPEVMELKLGEEFTPLSAGGDGAFDVPLAFVGYGITAPKEKYDDYAGIDVAGKAVVVLRREPQQADPKSVFDGDRLSAYAAFVHKIKNAQSHKAAAVVLVNDDFGLRKALTEARPKLAEAIEKLSQENAKLKASPTSDLPEMQNQLKRIDELARQVLAWGERMRAGCDPLPGTEGAGRSARADRMPVFFCRRAAMDRVVQRAIGRSLASLEQDIDKGPAPKSVVLAGWNARGETQFDRTTVEAKNVVGVLEGAGNLASQTIVVGAHYDHIAPGQAIPSGPAQLIARVIGRAVAPIPANALCPGADDNASGTAVMLEIAHRMAGQKTSPRRRIVFVAFTAEEMGLWGSQYYIENPPFPLATTVAMLNLDMVGRLRDRKLTIGGCDSAKRFDELADRSNARHGFQVTKAPATFGPSDQIPFFGRQIPSMHLFTGLHPDYHKPSDTFDKLNVAGMREIAEMAAEIVGALATDPTPPAFAAKTPGPVPFSPPN